MSDDKFNLYLYDSLAVSFNKITVDWTGIKKEAGKNDPFFMWDKLNNESYCFFNSMFYLLRFDSVNHVMKLVPRFSTKGERHFWRNIIYDSANSIYFLSTYTEGLFQVQVKQVQNVSFRDGGINDTIAVAPNNSALLKTSDSTVLAANGLEFTYRAEGETIAKKKGNISGNGETIARLSDTAILCIQHNQLVYFSKSDGFRESRFFNVSFNKNYRSFVTLLQTEGDSVWVCSDLGIFSLKQNSIRVLFYRKPDDKSLYFGSHLLYRLSTNELFFSNSFGLFKLKTIPPYTIDSFPDMKDKQVSGIIRYKDIFLLSVYKYGLFVLKGNTFHKVPLNKDQSELNFCHTIYLDTNENVWVTTDIGLCRFNSNESSFRFFNPNKMVVGGNIRNSVYKSQTGEFFFGGPNGFLSFFPDKIHVNKNVAPLMFTSFRLLHNQGEVSEDDNLLTKDISLTDQILFHYNQNTFMIGFALLSYVNSEKNTYAYKLEGLDKDWIQTRYNFITYPYLPRENIHY